MELPTKNEVTSPEIKTIPTANGNSVETQDKDVMVEGPGSVGVYDQWVAPQVSGSRPKPRYEVLVFFRFILKFIGYFFLV